MSAVAVTGVESEQSVSDQSIFVSVSVAAILGVALFYGVAFANSPTIHNAAHDVRHVATMPCH